MKKFIILLLLLVFTGCEEEVVVEESLTDPEEQQDILLIVGEGGPSGAMFIKAANTYKEEHGGEIYEVHNGDEFVAAMKDFVAKHGEIDHMEFFGHGNSVGLYVNQAPGVNGALYANDSDNNTSYVAASIYDLEPDVFGKFGWAKFNGCNVAEGFPEKETLASKFANYFDVDVVAPTGPTEFSQNPDGTDPIPNSNYLDSNFAGDVYMVPTYGEKGFVVVHPAEKVEGGYEDVREGDWFEGAVYGLRERGLELSDEDGRFWPYNNITYAEAQEFCKVAFPDSDCYVDGYAGHENDWGIRNLKALQMLVDAKGVSLKWSNPWYNSYVYWAGQNDVLTEDFVSKKWYTRGEMAVLTWNILNLE